MRIDIAGWIDGGLRDARLAFRSLRHSRLFTTAALATLTAAIALSTAVFSLVASVLLRPLPYPDSHRLVRLGEVRTDRPPLPGRGELLTSVTVGAWEQQKQALELLVPMSSSGKTVGITGAAEQLEVATVGSRFFELVGGRPLQGRLFDVDDERPNAPEVAIISNRLWMQMFGQRADVIGTSITLDALPHTIIGIAPAHVSLPEPGIDVWIPGKWRWPLPGNTSNVMMSIRVIGRMAHGASLEAVRAEGQRILQMIALASPAFNAGSSEIPQLRATRLIDDIVGESRPALVALVAGMVLVLIAACASLANLLVARNSVRARELAIRITLGASRGRLMRPLLFEQLLLVGTAALFGGLSAWWILQVLPRRAPATLPRLSEVAFDGMAFGLTALLALVTALLVGLRPAWRRRESGLRDTSGVPRIGVRSSVVPAEAFRSALVAAQVALAVVLLIGASLIGRSLLRLLQTPPGYQPAGVLTFQVGLPALIFREKGRQTQFFEALAERLQAVPGVTAVGVASKLPLHGFGSSGTFRIAGQPWPADPAEHPRARMTVVTEGYLAAIGTRLLAGRTITASDHAGAMPVVMVDEHLARLYFGGEAVSKQIHSIGGKVWTIVGVVETVKQQEVSGPDEAILYFPSRQVGEVLAYSRLSGGVVVRTSGELATLAPTVRGLVRELFPTAPVYNVLPLAERLDATFDRPRFYSLALALFATLALATAVLGVFGLQAYAVERRTAEFGVRRALGAGERHIIALVLRRALTLGALGLAAGLPLAGIAGGLLRSLLFGIRPVDPGTFAAVSIGVVVLVLAASWAPARRAVRVDPALALRAE